MYKIGIDAMGGDFAPEAAVMGAIAAAAAIGEDCRIVLFGAKDQIEEILNREN
ncbi:MAG: phosphate--acyl-ACP acyltransferase, partial [Rikenellaceae bacterium]|nr:phosphate--acyl-ACP acyltransferase [Rikenellaceae bacterium]